MTVFREREWRDNQGRMRPDLVVKIRNKAYILDVAICYEAGNSWEERRVAKEAKYKRLAALVRDDLGVEEAEVKGLVFGSRGAVPGPTIQTLRELGFSRKALTSVQFQIVADSLWAFREFRRRCQGWPVP